MADPPSGPLGGHLTGGLRCPPRSGPWPAFENLFLLLQGFDGGTMVLRDEATLYVVDGRGVHLLDLVAGLQTSSIATPPWDSPKAAALSLDQLQLLVMDDETIWTVELDAVRAPLGTVEAWQTAPNGFGRYGAGLAS